MENTTEIYEQIMTELSADNQDIRSRYLKHFGNEISEFAKAMSHAFFVWRELDGGVKGDEKKAHVSALVYSAITLHIISMKLLLWGYLVPAGNLQRQVIETIALALLCSGRDLGILQQYMEDTYRTNQALTDVIGQAEKLGLNEDTLRNLRQTRDFYHKFSHPSLRTLATHIEFSGSGYNLCFGPSFDEGKLDAYRKEVSIRVNLAKVFGDFVSGVIANVADW